MKINEITESRTEHKGYYDKNGQYYDSKEAYDEHMAGKEPTDDTITSNVEESKKNNLECTKNDPCGYCKKCKKRGTLKVTEKSSSKKQAKTMTAACKNAKFRKKVDIPKGVACDFHKADKGEYHKESKETLNPPSIDVGDEVKVGKFKNSKATVKGFKKDDHNQPVLKTNKGDKKLFSLRLSKLQESYEYAIRDEEFFTHEQHHAGKAELKAMGGGMFPSKAVREKYKPFGKLGKLTKPEQVMKHQLAGIGKHEWAFHAQYAEGSDMQCRICGRVQRLNKKGHTINR